MSEVRQALYQGDRTGAEALIAAGAVLNVFDAAAVGDPLILGELLADDRTSVEAWSADGFTALHFAAFLGGPDAVRLCIDAGADIGAVARNDMHVQPLHSAAANGSVESCRLLLEAGANPNAEQAGGFTPLDEAEHANKTELATLLRAYGARRSGNQLP